MSHRALSRLVAVVATLPVVVGVLPTGAAHATGGPAASLYAVPVAHAVVGPNVGWSHPVGAGPNGVDGLHPNDPSVNGRSPLFTVTTPAATDVVSTVSVVIGRTPGSPPISTFRDLAGSDGLALYADQPDAPGCPAGTFDACDLTNGLVSGGYSVNADPNGVRLNLGLDADSTGATTYFVALHPSDNVVVDRKITATLTTVTTTAGTVLPNQATPTLTIDSSPPSSPSRSSFVQHPQKPCAQQPTGVPCTEDYYTTATSEAQTVVDPDRELAFFNGAATTDLADLLVHPDGSDVFGVLPTGTTQPTNVPIGDGSGKNAANPLALNHQASDNVYVRAVDFAGNFSGGAANLDAGDSTVTPVIPNLQNDVTAPTVSSTTAAITALGVNVNNKTAVPVSVSVINPTTTEGSALQVARLLAVDQDGHAIPGKETSFASTPRTDSKTAKAIVTNVNAFIYSDGGAVDDGVRFAVEAEVRDALGNSTAPIYSPRTADGVFTTTWLKDTQQPRVVSVQPVQGSTTKFDIYFSEPVLASTIGESTATPQTVGTPPNTTTTNTCANTKNCINTVLKLTTNDLSTADWGQNPAFAWADKSGTTAAATASHGVVTVGSVPSSVASTYHEARIGDGIDGVTPAIITDPNGNTLFNLTTITSVTLNTIKSVITVDRGCVSAADVTVTTCDPVSTYGQLRDGYLDAVDVTFDEPISVPADQSTVNIALRGKTETDLVKRVIFLSADHSSARLLFSGTLKTDEKPSLEVGPNVTDVGNPLGITSTHSIRYSPFTAVDKAPPALMRAATVDSAPANGRIDKVVLTFSEPLDSTKEQCDGYAVSGYTDATPDPSANPSGYATCSGSVNSSYNTFTPGTDPTQVVLNLQEKAAPTLDTNATPSFSYGYCPALPATVGCSQTGAGPTDAAGNVAPDSGASVSGVHPSFSGTAADGAGPVPLTVTTRDTDGNGKIDALDLVYTESFDDTSLANADFTVEGHRVLSVLAIADRTLRLILDEQGPTVLGDTDAKPSVTYDGGPNNGLTDLNGVPAAPGPVAAPSDGAGPELVAATRKFEGSTGDGTQIQVKFSEPVDQASAETAAAYAVTNHAFGVDGNNQPNIVAPASVALGDDKMTAVLTLSSPLAVGYATTIALSNAGQVKDAAPAANTNSSTTVFNLPADLVAGTYHPLNPTRILDTRGDSSHAPVGAPVGPVGPKADLAQADGSTGLTVTGVAGVPATGVDSVVLNLTVVSPTAPTAVTVYPDGTSLPNASNVNVTAGKIVPNLVTVRVGQSGRVQIHNGGNGSVHFVADVAGYYSSIEDTSAGSTYVPLTPGRDLDTRTSIGGHQGPLGTGEPYGLTVVGVNGVPATGVAAVAISLTGINPSAPTVLRTYPTPADPSTIPNVSNLNLVKGQVAANMAIVPVLADGKIQVRNNSGTVHVVVDVVGYYTQGTAAGGSIYTSYAAPVRILDTRPNSGPSTHDYKLGAADPAAPGSPATKVVDLSAGVPGGGSGIAATGVVGNLTVTNPSLPSFLTIFPTGGTVPNASNLNFVKGLTVAVHTMPALSSTGSISIYNAYGTADVILDVSGYFSTPCATGCA